ncbi:MocR-like pyridoxine biosynthesis transcription factor PdxR [Virgisporangium aurantiacum]|uniref:GntR family transcriptional regulator n=1 Tax=Virgisporangium aurantiacum TaxID=175570 RepID=A0A8J3ZFR8_9ACTN|nr:PLP-dependent aminotransferase family protein [Virgisporangium aurantiacum]GIJ63302.1 GntR family transcriptional regulator [Virgisporangium aurantiacum]
MELHVWIDRDANLGEQLYRQVRAGILETRLRAGEAMPPSRQLAVRLGISRNTVTAAYDRLVAEGYLTTRAGAGTFVNNLSLPDAGSGGERPAGPLRPRSGWDEVGLPDGLTGTPAFDFRVGVPDVHLFPHMTWRRLVADQLRGGAMGNGMPADPAGHLGLRAALARRLRLFRGVTAGCDDVVVTSGAQQAIDLIGRVLLEPGACAAVEEPGYWSPVYAWRSVGARVATVPVDGEGLVVDALPPAVRLVYVTPSHQFPTGVAMSLRRRMDLLAWARRNGAAIVEDDYDSEFRYTTQPLESLHSLDRDGRVLYIGTFSKVMLPTLRIGFVVVPPGLRHAVQAAKFVTDWHTSLPTQAALAGFLDEGALDRHLKRAGREYRKRRDRITASLAGPLSPWLSLIPSAAGLHLSAFFRHPDRIDVGRLLARADTAGVALWGFPWTPTTGPGSRPGLMFGFGAIATDRVDEGLRRLHRCLAADA